MRFQGLDFAERIGLIHLWPGTMLQRIEYYFSRALVFLLVVQGAALVVLIGIEVLYRYVLHSALSWPEEVAGIVFVWFTLLGVAVGLREESHISFDLVTKRSPPLLRKAILVFAHLTAIVYAGFMIRYGWSYAWMFSFETTPAAEINTLWLNLSLPVSGVLIALFALLKIIHVVQADTDVEELS